MSQPNLWIAFAAGVVSFLSPCILPLVPGYISFMSGLSLEDLSRGANRQEILKRAGLGSVFFVLGFSLVFTVLGASASAVGRLLSDHISVISKIAGVVIILFGLHTIGLLKIKWLYYEKRFEAGKIPAGFFGAFLMGLAFAFGWTPCIGPILSGILALAAVEGSALKGTGLLFAYSMGIGIPFIITGFATGRFLEFFRLYKRYIRWGEIAAGLILVFVGVLIFTQKLTILTGMLPKWLLKFSL